MKQNRTVRLIGRCGALALATIFSCGAFAACSKDKDPDPDAGKATGTIAPTEEVTTADPHQKTFTSAGMTITLSDDFQKSTVPGYTVGFESDDAVLLALVENDDALKGYTLDQYANKVISNNASLKGKTVKHDGGLTYFEFESTADGVTYSYLAVVYQNGSDYWLFQFASQKKDYNSMRANFMKYAKTVRFN